MENALDRAMWPSPEAIICAKTDERVNLASVATPCIENLIGLSGSPKMFWARFAMFLQTGTRLGDRIKLPQIDLWSAARVSVLFMLLSRDLRAPEESFSPDQQTIDFIRRNIAITMLSGMMQPAFRRTFVFREINGQPFS
jgi:hypothetical protein